jgi:glucose/arabinose dehydrogenase
MVFYKGAMFPQWNGSALISGMSSQTLNRVTFDGKGGATAAERWSVGHRMRDVAVAPDGAVWMIEDANPGGLFRVTPSSAAASAPITRGDKAGPVKRMGALAGSTAPAQ